MKTGYIYILSNKRNGTLYTGVSNNLMQSVWQHTKHLVDGFTKKYDASRLVYFETYDDIQNAIAREKQIKAWNRKCKLSLIENENPDWTDLYDSILD
jgi:putative endonuclease